MIEPEEKEMEKMKRNYLQQLWDRKKVKAT